MPTNVQTDRPLILTTPLGADKLLAIGLHARESISELFQFDMECKAESGTAVDFGKLLGQKVSMKLEVPPQKERFFSGICSRVTQGESDQDFDYYRLEVVPQFWLLTKRAQSRIFQHVNVPDILKKVLTGLDVVLQIQGTFEPRDYCVQYRETDFDFASRLMEEEGIYYFFKHTASGSQMVVANTPQSHTDLQPTSALQFKALSQGAAVDNQAIYLLSKSQEVTSGKFTLWDHNFQLPHKHLEADKPITDSVQVGRAAHTLKVANNSTLEVYDWPGEYAERFDGVNRSGGDQPAELQKIFTDNKRTVGLRMEAAATTAVVLRGASNLRHLAPGFKVTITTINDTSKPLQVDGPFVLTSVKHTALMGANFRSGGGQGFTYNNSFTLMPAAVPFRPERTTYKPFVGGPQTAVVVGPQGEEIFTDRHGRVKVQFHWDREGKSDADSSCWIRVTQPWAGNRWGGFFIPRIGQEVIVDFVEGDADRPIVVGCVYNPEQPHPYLGDGPDTSNMNNHKQNPRVCGVKTNTTPGGGGFNEWRFDDTKGKEQVFIQAQRDHDLRINNDRREIIGHDTHLIVGGQDKHGNKCGDQTETIWQDRHQTVHRDHSEQVMGNVQYMVGHGDAASGGNVDIVIEKNKQELIEQSSHQHVMSDKFVVVDKNYHFVIGVAAATDVGADYDLTVGGEHRTTIGANHSVIVGGYQVQSVGKNASLIVEGKHLVKVNDNMITKVAKNQLVKTGLVHAQLADNFIVKGNTGVIIEAGTMLTLKCGSSFIVMTSDGIVAIAGTMVKINSGGSPGSGQEPASHDPEKTIKVKKPVKANNASQAKPAQPNVADGALSGQISNRGAANRGTANRGTANR